MKGKMSPKKRAFMEAILGPEKTALLEQGKELPAPKVPHYSWMKSKAPEPATAFEAMVEGVAYKNTVETRIPPAVDAMMAKLFRV